MENINYKGYNIDIEYDDWADNPREWTNLSTILYAHGKYELGDINIKEQYPEAGSWEEVEKLIKRDYKPEIIVSLYLYEHGNLWLKIGDFHGQLPQGHAEFDSGMIGFAIVTKESIKKAYNLKRVSKESVNRAKEVLESEVETYAKYVRGECYALTVSKDDNYIESIGGFYDYDYAIADAKSIIDYDIKRKRESKQRKLKAFIKNNVSLQTRQQTFAS